MLPDAFKWGARISIPRIVFEDKISKSWQMRRVQFPLRLALAVTVNKAQGQSIRKCGVLLRKHLFSHGQLYVALSRVADSPADNIKVMITARVDGAANPGGRITDNVVFPGIIDAMEAAGSQTIALEGPGDEVTPTSPVTSAPVAAETAAYPPAHVVSAVVAMPSFAVGTEVTQRFHGFCCEMDGEVTGPRQTDNRCTTCSTKTETTRT